MKPHISKVRGRWQMSGWVDAEGFPMVAIWQFGPFRDALAMFKDICDRNRCR